MLRLLLFAAFFLLSPAVPAKPVVVADLHGAISPASADYFLRALTAAEEAGAALLVVRLDTPGGLDSAMRRQIQGILGAQVPVAVFVAPSGARAASAGTYLIYAAHIAAMAPGTNLGAATPVPLGLGGGPAPEKGQGRERAGGGSMETKAMQDAAAYLRSLAQLRGRNAQWAEAAVREAASLSAAEALKLKVIDVVAADLPALLREIDGRQVRVGEREVRLDLRAAPIVTIERNWQERLLAVIADPNIALVLIMIGVLGLFFEFSSPGMVAPGVVGAIALLLGFYGLALLPVNFAGAGLLLLGLALMAAEAFMPSFGALGIGGIAAFIAGALMLVDAGAPGLGISWLLVAPLAIIGTLLFTAIGTFALRARRRPPAAGAEAMLGGRVEALEDIEREGWVRAAGERWQARTAAPLRRGAAARIVAMDGLTLVVEPEREGGRQ